MAMFQTASSEAAGCPPFKLRILTFNLWAVPFVGVKTVWTLAVIRRLSFVHYIITPWHAGRAY
jgi:hypothetical protein